MELDENEEDTEDNSSEGWETEDDDEEEEEEEDESDDSFEDGDIDVSDNEVLYDQDRNVITEEDIREGLKEIVECHMSRLRRPCGANKCRKVIRHGHKPFTMTWGHFSRCGW